VVEALSGIAPPSLKSAFGAKRTWTGRQKPDGSVENDPERTSAASHVAAATASSLYQNTRVKPPPKHKGETMLRRRTCPMVMIAAAD